MKKTIRAKDSKYFRGEMMICAKCLRKQRSNPKKSSDWTIIQADNIPPVYICPECFGVPGYKKSASVDT